jgi:hypothetical protein
MSTWFPADLAAQYHRALAAGWIPFFENSAALHGFAPEFLMAIASRETNMENIRGDERDGVFHGFGIMQIDVAAFPDFCRSWTAEQLEQSIEFATRILAGKRDYLAKHNIRDLKSLAAAYNTGEGNVVHSYQIHRDVDFTSAYGNYGHDVLARMQVFVNLRNASPDAPAANVRLT